MLKEREKRSKLEEVLKAYKKYGVKLKGDVDDLQELEQRLAHKINLKLENKAAIKIQAWVRMHQTKNKYKKFLIKRQSAAKYIQLFWRKYRYVAQSQLFHSLITLVPKAWQLLKSHNISIIQKFIRGYLTHKKYQKIMHTSKLQKNYKFFNILKEKLHSDSQIKIRYFWRLKKRRQKIKEKIEEAKSKAGKSKVDADYMEF